MRFKHLSECSNCPYIAPFGAGCHVAVDTGRHRVHRGDPAGGSSRTPPVTDWVRRVTKLSGETEPLLTPEEVAETLRINVRTLYRRWREGTGPEYVQVGPRERRVARSALTAYVERNTVAVAK